MTIKRLFDCLDHQLQHFPKKDMLAAKENGEWVTVCNTTGCRYGEPF
jgi:long-chain acyl-CoA synthetase